MPLDFFFFYQRSHDNRTTQSRTRENTKQRKNIKTNNISPLPSTHPLTPAHKTHGILRGSRNFTTTNFTTKSVTNSPTKANAEDSPNCKRSGTNSTETQRTEPSTQTPVPASHPANSIHHPPAPIRVLPKCTPNSPNNWNANNCRRAKILIEDADSC
ncbi:hypothetical protein E2C01_089244 [Portunus trituberculatus]|uniref:Uncharacterized protein n=1 Tax=Portunus trituberculatus TaxID=210409 RepID=A0A5B7JD05_PORTR|nr:hypothetical protein [Portunus trituberculatus]